MNRKLKVLISGTGFAGQGHTDALRNVGAEVVGIVGRTESVLTEVAEFVGFGGDKMKEVFDHPLSLENGYLHVNDTPGLGVNFNELEASKHPYKRSYLPVSRLEDGTLWDW